MPSPSPEKIADIILCRRAVYDITTDTAIRSAGEKLSARSIFVLLSKTDETSPDFESQVRESLPPFINDDTVWAGEIMQPVFDDEPVVQEITGTTIVYLRLVFRDAECAYWQFPLFPTLSHVGITGAGRKREGAVQHIRLEVTTKEVADELITEWLGENYHLLRVEPSDEATFVNAPSHAV